MHVVCVGDCGVDRYLPLAQDRAGGITLNFAVHARRLFAPEDRVTVVSALGDDTEANIVTAALDELRIEAYLAELPGRTSLQHIDLDPSGEKIFVRYEQGVLGDYRVGPALLHGPEQIADLPVPVARVTPRSTYRASRARSSC